MVVQHNLTAMNSNRMLGLTTKTQAKSTEKLSSGYKINHAADDAAGLFISEKMRKQIRGLTQASSNAQDGISAVQTAEGALNEVQDMLQRMNELAVKASNGTNSETDRSYIQNEIDQLTTEIDRVSETTKFNETYLLKGKTEGKVGSTATTATIAGKAATINAGTTVNAGDVVLGSIDVVKAGNAITSLDKDMLKTSSLATALNNTVNAPAGVLTLTATVTGTNRMWTDVTGVQYSDKELNDAGITWTAANAPTDNQTVTLTKSFVANSDLAESKVNYATPPANTDIATAGLKFGEDVKATIKVNASGVATINAYDSTYVPKAISLDLQVGADSTSNNKINMTISSMSAKAIGVQNLKVDGKDSTNADAAIDTISAAIQKVSTQRSSLGAIQNRLEHTISNLDNVVENTTSAESQIRDTDMATEMVKYSNNNILTQAGQAMLAQANQSNQGVLSLLQ